ncbi:MAG: outer membrane protein assembly factor BamA [Thermodesulfobacteriota bacterium]|nr:outer membrane protein assembly factor BamA [Thermodesulfobacteriota bacterium]
MINKEKLIFINKILSLIFIFCFSFSKAEAKNDLKIAVFPFSVTAPSVYFYLSDGICEILSSRISQNLLFETIDRSKIDPLLKEKKVDYADLEELRKLGDALGVDWVVVGELTISDEEITLSTRAVSMLKPAGFKNYEFKCDSIEAILEKLNILSKEISREIIGDRLIHQVTVKGNKKMEDEVILNQIKTIKGELYTKTIVSDDIKRLYEMGYFDDIMVDSINTPQGRKVTFIVKEKAVITEIKILGNKNIDIIDIQKEIKTKNLDILNLNIIKEDLESIRTMYKNKGFYNVEVDYKTYPIEEDKVSVNFIIVENKKTRIKRVKFHGNKAIKSRKLKKYLENKEPWLFSFITGSGIYKEDLIKSDMSKISALYFIKGYLQVKVEEPKVSFKKDGIYIDFYINEGEQFKVGNIDLDGDIITDKNDIFKVTQLKPGMIFNQKLVQDDIMQITEYYSNFGYAYVDVSPLTRIKREAKTVDLVYSINKDKKVYIEKINIKGNTRTRDHVIRRELRIAEGEIYNAAKLKISRQEVNNLGYFNKVNFNKVPGSADDKIVLNVEVEDKPTGMIGMGAGYSSTDKLMGMFQVSQNNLFGRGQQLNVQAQLGGVSSRYNIGFTEPWLYNRPISAGVDIFNWDREYEDFDKESRGGDIRIGFRVADFTRTYFMYKYEAVDISEIDYDASYEIRASEGESKTSSFTSSIVRDSRNDRFVPTHGTKSSFSFEFAGGPLGAENQFIKVIGEHSHYFPFKWDTAFMVRGVIGAGFGYGGEDLPVFERFFLGGLNNLRGFEEREVGPRAPRINPETGQPIPGEYDIVGGEKELFFNFEYLFPLVKQAGIRGLVFLDAGNAFADDESFGSEFRYSVGTGVRWQSPMGPLRLEWGLNLDPYSDEDRSKFEFSFGSMF